MRESDYGRGSYLGCGAAGSLGDSVGEGGRQVDGAALLERGQKVQKVGYLTLIALLLLLVLIVGNIVVRWLVTQFLSSPF